MEATLNNQAILKNASGDLTILCCMYTKNLKLFKRNLNENPWLLDGHFCIWNINGQAEAIDLCVFQQRGVSKIIVFKDSPSAIHARLSDRDMSNYDIEKPRQIQEMELNQVQFVAKKLSIFVTILTAFDVQGFQNVIGRICEQET